jgi:ATP-dependent exoDNAse (exonuclease V) beta subunit
MERRVRENSHARCGVGERPEIISGAYLSLFIIWQVEAFRVYSRSRTYKESDYTLFSEYRRLLYVAMTRAKEYLYLMQTAPASGLNFISELRNLADKEEREEKT